MTKGDRWMHLSVLGLALISLLSAGGSYLYFKLGKRAGTVAGPLVIQFAYPVISIDPPAYDDWQSVFIGNHIYPRLLPEEHRPWIPFVADGVDVRCVIPDVSPNDEKCTEIRIAFKPRPFSDCMGRDYSAEDIRKEFEAILAVKSWALPQWKRCEEVGSGEVCVIGKNTSDAARRMRNTNMRFGWSKKEAEDQRFGAGPYCLSATHEKDGTLSGGVMSPHIASPKLPSIEFRVSQDKDLDFSLALYGSKNLLKGARRNVQTHTPLAYYVISNPKYADLQLPWHSLETKRLIHSFLVSHEVFFPENDHLAALVPQGSPPENETAVPSLASMPLEFVIPDYLPDCEELAESLTKIWSKNNQARAVCRDIVSYVMQNVRGKKDGNWHGFAVGVSASDPGRDSVRVQYFSPLSPESWTYDYPTPERFYYLVGMGQSLVTVDSDKICDLRPNPLGLGDVFATDLVPCGKR